MASATALVIAPFLAYDQVMRYLAAITMLILALALVQPVAAQSRALSLTSSLVCDIFRAWKDFLRDLIFCRATG